MVKRILITIALTMVVVALMAQETITLQDESFILDSVFTQKTNYKFVASDSIVLDTNFCRLSHTFPYHYYYTELAIDENGVYPPSFGMQGGPNESDRGCVGTLGGTVDVGMMGEANNCIPIDLPAGINGMSPELSIVYNSQNGNGLLGWRWELNGLSSITRAGKTRYHDGVTGGVTLSDNNDRFLLDGQRLIAIQRYADSVEFKTELDEMSRIVAYLSRYNNGTKVISHFKVWKSDGRILEYGVTNDSRIGTQDNRPNALCWLINQIRDRNGNAIRFHYDVSNETGEFYVSQIRYTENEDLKIAPEYVINFVYRKNDRMDYDFKYIAGSIIQKKKLLERMEIMRSSNEELLSKYSFQYDEIDLYDTYDSVHMYNRLREINYEKGEMALNPTRIEWTSYGDASVVCKSDICNQAIYDNFPFVGDFNGDGYSDLAVVPFKNDSIYYPAPVDVQFFMNNQNDGFFLGQCWDGYPTK